MDDDAALVLLLQLMLLFSILSCVLQGPTLQS
jgi:hypothetical protein